MKTANQHSSVTYEASLQVDPNDLIRIVFENIDWSFIHSLVSISSYHNYISTTVTVEGYTIVYIT